MASVTIKNMPDRLLRELRSRAASHRRSLNSEVIACLESLMGPRPVDPEALLADIRARRPVVKRPVTDAMINRFKKMGRL